MHDYTTTKGRVAALRAILEDLTTYTSETGRFGMSDLGLLEELDMRRLARDEDADYPLAGEPDDAMAAILDAGAVVSIGDKHGYVWEQFSDDTVGVMETLGLVAETDDDKVGRCESCGADISEYAAGETECVLCTGEGD